MNEQETPLETPERLVARVCVKYGITPRDLRGASRKSWVVRARRDVSRRLRALGLSYEHIGRMIGRDHSSVMYLLASKGR